MNETLLLFGLLAVALGTALLVLGAILSGLTRRNGEEPTRSKKAGVVLIGPFPIIFGDKDLIKYSLLLLLIFIALSLVFLLSFLSLA